MKITVELTAEQWAEILYAAESNEWPSESTDAATLALCEELSKKGIPGR